MNARAPVSVVMPAFNREKFVGEAISSLQDQISAESEIIVVDDGSSDATAEIVQAIRARDPRVQLVRQSHRGAAAARNAGIALAVNKYLTFLDSDDICVPGRIPRQIAKLEPREDLSAVVGELVLFDAMEKGFLPAAGSRWERVLGVSLTAATFRTSSLRAVGPLNETLGQGEDLDAYLRLFEAGARFLLEVEPAVYYRQHSGNMTKNVGELRRDVLRAYAASRTRQRQVGWVPEVETFFFKQLSSETEFCWPRSTLGHDEASISRGG